MQAERRPDVFRVLGQLMVSGPGLGRRRHGQGEHALSLTIGNRLDVIRVEVEVTVKIDKGVGTHCGLLAGNGFHAMQQFPDFLQSATIDIGEFVQTSRVIA